MGVAAAVAGRTARTAMNNTVIKTKTKREGEVKPLIVASLFTYSLPFERPSEIQKNRPSSMKAMVGFRCLISDYLLRKHALRSLSKYYYSKEQARRKPLKYWMFPNAFDFPLVKDKPLMNRIMQ
jgi:hypothetical protein